MSLSLPEYYSRRAEVYEEVYHRDDSLRQAEIADLKQTLRTSFQDQNVLEVACGTGYWTSVIAEVAKSITAVDAAEGMLRIARAKSLLADRVCFVAGDAYDLSNVAGTFTAGFAGFWLSHIPKSRLIEFLTGFHRKLTSGARVMFFDNVHVPEFGGDLLTPSGEADTYKRRELPDGSTCEVLKNYYSADELRQLFTPWSQGLPRVEVRQFYWLVSYEQAGLP
jgi:ubiquinone/menaquinone biosynthesis C-methylase UbiE